MGLCKKGWRLQSFRKNRCILRKNWQNTNAGKRPVKILGYENIFIFIYNGFSFIFFVAEKCVTGGLLPLCNYAHSKSLLRHFFIMLNFAKYFLISKHNFVLKLQ